MFTGGDDGLHSELVAALLDAAGEGGDVLLLSEGVGLRKHHLYLANVALLKAPAGVRNVTVCSLTLTSRMSSNPRAFGKSNSCVMNEYYKGVTAEAIHAYMNIACAQDHSTFLHLSTYLCIMSWTPCLSLVKVVVSQRLYSMATTVSMLLNMSASTLYWYGRDNPGAAAWARLWYRW